MITIKYLMNLIKIHALLAFPAVILTSNFQILGMNNGVSFSVAFDISHFINLQLINLQNHYCRACLLDVADEQLHDVFRCCAFSSL